MIELAYPHEPSAIRRRPRGWTCLTASILASALLFPTSSMATALPLSWKTYPTSEKLAAPDVAVHFSISGDVLVVDVRAAEADSLSLRAVRRVPDDFLENDTRLLVYIDSAGTGQFARVFGITPLGGVLDGTYQEGQSVDAGADFRWTATASITRYGWTAQMRIPLDQLGLHAGSKPHAYVEYYRIGDHIETVSTADPKANGGCLLCSATPIAELEAIGLPPATIRLQPSIYALVGHSTAKGSSTAYQQEKASLDAEWQPTTALDVRGTLNPNFAEREPDIPVLRHGTQFSPTLTERRQFFARDTSLLQTPGLALVNTRAIAAPTLALAGDYENGGTRGASLISDDSAGGELVIPGSYGNGIALAPASRNGIFRTVQSARAGVLGITATDREFDGIGASRLLAVDGAARWGGGYTGTGLLAVSSAGVCGTSAGALTSCPQFGGHAAYASLRNQTPLEGWRLGYTDVSPGFRADMGSVYQVGYRSFDAKYTRDFDNASGALKRFELAPHVRASEDYAGRAIERTAELYSAAVSGSGGASLTVRPYSQIRLSAASVPVNARQAEVWLMLSPGTAISKLAVDVAAGELPDFSNGMPGRGASVSAEISGAVAGNLGFQTAVLGYWTRASGAVPRFTGPSYKETQFIGILNWQYATFSRVRYVATFGRADGVILLDRAVPYQASTQAHSLLWEHAPREGWGWTLGITTVHNPSGQMSNWELLTKLRYAY
jgi:hypothetical protein